MVYGNLDRLFLFKLCDKTLYECLILILILFYSATSINY